MTSYFTLIDERQPSARSRHRMKRMKGFERPLMTDTPRRVICQTESSSERGRLFKHTSAVAARL